MEFIQVVLPLKLPFDPWYKSARKHVPGDRVPVRFSGRDYTAVITTVSPEPPEGLDPVKIKKAGEHELRLSPVTPGELKFWKFISEYYMCTTGEVYKAAYPENKVSGETSLAAAEKRRKEKAEKEKEYRKTILGGLNARLAKKTAALAQNHTEAVAERLRAERDKIIASITETESKILACDLQEQQQEEPTRATRTRDAATKSILSSLSSDGRPVLVKGGAEREKITAELIRDTLASGKNALLIIPEIKASETLLKRIAKAVGENSMYTYNSSSSMGKRRDVADILREKGSPIAVVGTRSALFLPFDNLGMVIVADENSHYHKQDSTPRFNARDAATVLARIHGAYTVLTSVFPSLESTMNVRSGKYRIHECNDKVQNIDIIGTLVERAKGGMAGCLSIKLIRKIQAAARENRKSIILTTWGNSDATMTETVINDISTYLKEETTSGLVETAPLLEKKAANLSKYGVVALIDAERLTMTKDFRADEKNAQTIATLASRCGCVLTVQVVNPGTQFLKPEDELTEILLSEREFFGYPPFKRLIDITIRDSSPKRREYLASLLTRQLGNYNPLGPFVDKKQNTPEEEESTIRISLSKNENTLATKTHILNTIRDFEAAKKYQGHIFVNADPV